MRLNTVPDAPPPSATQVAALSDFIAHARKLLVITGAGISTESGVPDYRSPGGAYSTGFKPMTHQEFLSGDVARRRYWARSFAGWRAFAERTRPNAAHAALAAMQRAGRVHALITQNVDRLHQAAGATEVLELHGTTHRVVCLACGADSCRRELQTQLAAMNPGAAAEQAAVDAGAPRGLARTAAPVVNTLQRPDGACMLRAAWALQLACCLRRGRHWPMPYARCAF
jgi:NAD-dependent deacetylase sirtuin 4